MRVCFLCADYPPGPHGGIGTMMQLLGRALVKEGHSVRVAGVYPPSYPAPDRHSDEGVEVWRVREPPRRFGWISARRQLWKLVSGWARRGEIDIIEAPDYQGWIAGWRGLDIPAVVRLNGSSSYFAVEMGQRPDSLTFRIEKAALDRADAWCSVSRYTADQTKVLFALRSDPSAILYNPVESGFEAVPAAARTSNVVFSGTLVEKKGVLSLIKAWPGVLERIPEARLHIYGKDSRMSQGGSMRERLESMLPEHARTTVRFHGHVTRQDLFAALATAGAAVFPSYAEAFALAPLEAMTMATPTVYSTRGSGPELIDDGTDGLLVDPAAPDQITAALVRVLADPAAAAAMGAAGRAKILASFSMRNLLPKNIAFYQGVIDQFKRTRRARS
jgi:glycosyltransferase involved in cell wall biosynthesis